VIADRPQTIVWAFTLSSRTSIWRFMAIWPSVESLFSITPLPGGAGRRGPGAGGRGPGDCCVTLGSFGSERTLSFS